MFDPNVSSHLIADEGEIIVDEVRKHWVVRVGPLAEVFAGVVVLFSILWFPARVVLLPLAVGLGLGLHGGWRLLAAHMDRFVITNMRVFRVHGILDQNIATMPLARILDISVNKPMVGRVLGYGHFVFESAAQIQGLSKILFVGNPDERDLTIQRVIQRSGLRGGTKTG